MKRLWIALTVLTMLALLAWTGSLSPARAGDNVWTPSSQGMEGAYVTALAISPGFAADSTIFAGTFGDGVFKSTDGGASWSAANNGLTNLLINDLALSPDYAADHTLFAGSFYYEGSTAYGGVYKSTDGGASWTAAGLTNRNVNVLALSPDYASDRTLFASTYPGYPDGVFKSTDGGGSWGAANNGLPTPVNYALALSPGYASDRTLFAGTWGYGVYKSTDGGASWHASGLIRQMLIEALALSPDYASDHTVFAGTYSDGVFKSTDSGDSWRSAGLAERFVNPLALSPNYVSDHTLFAGVRAGDDLDPRGVYVSTDDGASWSAMNQGLDDLEILALALTATDPMVLFASTPSGVWQYTYSAPLPTPTPTPVPCPAEVTLDGPSRGADLATLWRFRDEVLAASPTGQRYVAAYYRHAPELTRLLLADASLRARTAALLRELLPDIRSLLDEGSGQKATFTAERAGRVQTLLADLGRSASPGLRGELNALSAKAGQYAGKSLREMWELEKK